ncbi:MAG TPA: helix-turn-helix domain-containing protein [Acidimicrobiia bacterium]|nr:helix-turn-helix domain-containing protein [Acidimicrobiia bacterium]
MEPQALPELLTAEEVANLLRVKVSTIYDAAARGQLPVVRVWQGARRALVRFRRQDIERILSASSQSRG